MDKVEVARHLQEFVRTLARIRHRRFRVKDMDLKKVLDQTVREL